MLTLVLYDIPSKLPGNTFSPNTAKPRFALSYKNLPFESVWLEFPDIAPKLKEIGASPNKLPDGRELYTAPVLSDPNTGAIITDSWAIAEYLDETYPEKPIFPPESKGLIKAFDSALRVLQRGSLGFTILRSSQVLNESSFGYYITTRETFFGDKVDKWSPEGSKRDAHWAIIENDFYGSAKEWYEKAKGKWMMGDTFSYADILFASWCFWLKRILLDDEWKRIASLHDGKWARLLDEVQKECNVEPL